MKNIFDGKFGTDLEDELLLEKIVAAAPAEVPKAPVEEGTDWGHIAAKGLAGLGDAITGAYGTNKTNFSQQVADIPLQRQKQEEIKLGLDEKKRKAETEAGTLKRLSDPTSVESLAAQEQAQKLGLFKGRDVSKFSATQLSKFLGDQLKIADLENKQTTSSNTKSHQDRMADLKEREIGDLKTHRAALLAKATKDPYKALSEPTKIQVQEIAKKNAGTQYVKNSIDAALAQLDDPNQSEEQKVKTGQGLLKTLNSTQGADAVGAEEAKRLGSFLEYKIANFRQPGGFWGRDVQDFVEQVRNKSTELGAIIKSNDQVLAELGQGKALSQGAGAETKARPGFMAEAQAGDVPAVPKIQSVGDIDNMSVEELNQYLGR
jgi:hypothetical protein